MKIIFIVRYTEFFQFQCPAQISYGVIVIALTKTKFISFGLNCI